MADDQNNEPSSRTDPGLDGLPAAERAETEKILNEIDPPAPKPADEPNKPDGGKKPEEDGKKPPENDKKPDAGKEGKPEDGDKHPPEKRREVKLMPSWLHERAKADWEKRENELKGEIEKAKKGNVAKTEGEGDAQKPADGVDDSKEIDALAEKHGISADLAKDLIGIVAKRGGLPADVSKKLAEIDSFREQQAIAAEAAAFNTDFEKSILPLIKAEYGDDVPPDTVARLREELKGLAYTPEFAKVPYDVLYRGDNRFREALPPKKRGAEGARGAAAGAAAGAGAEGELDLTKPLSEEQLKGLTDSQFEEYEKNMVTYERSQRK